MSRITFTVHCWSATTLANDLILVDLDDGQQFSVLPFLPQPSGSCSAERPLICVHKVPSFWILSLELWSSPAPSPLGPGSYSVFLSSPALDFFPSEAFSRWSLHLARSCVQSLGHARPQIPTRGRAGLSRAPAGLPPATCWTGQDLQLVSLSRTSCWGPGRLTWFVNWDRGC